MKRKNIFLTLLIGAVACFQVACSDWIEVEHQDIDKVLEHSDRAMAEANEKYHENLRAYKQTDHSLTFGWFAAWAADGPGSTFLSQLPDSTDLVALWGESLWAHPTKAMLEDLKYAQEVKGLRVVTACLLFDIGKGLTPPVPDDYGEKHPDIPQSRHWETWNKSYWGWEDGNEEAILKSIETYANALCDTIFKFGYDGFDLDAEPSYAQPFPTNKEMWRPASRMYHFFETMAKRIGPMAETEEGRKKLLIVDGEPDWFPAKYGTYMNYYIFQTYGTSSNARLDNKLQSLINHFSGVVSAEEVANKMIVTEEFEKYAGTGGVRFYTPDGRVVPSYLGFAEWEPFGGKYRKGGIGCYHMQRDFANTTRVYDYLRKGIQIMNPAVK